MGLTNAGRIATDEREIDEPAALRRATGNQRDTRPRIEIQLGPRGRARTQVTALVATGAEASFVLNDVAERLGLSRKAAATWRLRGDEGTTLVEVAEASFGLPDGTTVAEQIELGCVARLPDGCEVIMGRDMLADTTFRYDGATGQARLKAG